MNTRRYLVTVVWIATIVFIWCQNKSVATDILSEDEQAYLREKGTVVFVSQTNYPPFEFVDKSGERTGMCIELARWMATDLGFTARFTDMTFKEAQQAVLSGKAHVLTSLFFSEKRDETFEFTQAIFQVPASIFVVAQRTDMKGIADLNGKRIAMQAGDYAREFLTAQKVDFEVIYTKDFASATDLVVSGEADAVVGDEQIVLYHIYKNRLVDKIKKIGDPLYIGLNCMATNESNHRLTSILNKGIAHAQNSGVLERINRKWIGTHYKLEQSIFIRYRSHMIVGFGIVFVLVTLTWAWNIRLRKEVDNRTRALQAAHDELELKVKDRTSDLQEANQQLSIEIEERKRVETERLAYLRSLEYLEQIDRVIRQTSDLEQMMKRVLETVLSVFQCDRAWLLYPCDPNAPSFRVPMECTKPEYPGAFSFGAEVSLTEELASFIQRSMASEDPVRFDPESEYRIPASLEKRFNVRSQMDMAIYPKLGAPWLFGMHQCEFARVWTKEEKWLFKEVGRRVTDALSSLLFLRDLLESKEQYRDLVENINEVLFSIDDAGRFTYVSPSVEFMTGYRPSEVIGKPAENYVLDEDQRLFAVYLKMVLAGKRQVSEFRVRKKSGGVSWIYVSAKPLSSDDGIIGLQGIATDIDELKRAEEEKRALEEKLARSQKMEALGFLAGGVAHDLNNVLSGIVSYPELLLLDIPEGSALREPLLTIRDSGKKAATIVQDLLALARRGVMSVNVLNLNDVISDYLKSPEFKNLRHYHPEVDIATTLDPNLLNTKGSPVHLKKAIMNLVSNAAEAQPDGGKVTITTENRYVDTPIKGYDDIEEGDFVLVTIADNGIGIARDDLARIFEPFYTKKVMGRSGTGLGMAVVWGTIQDHQGYINIESVEGEGTAFELYFPVTRESMAEEKGVIPLANYVGNGETILVVDDVADQRTIATAMLTKLGYAVSTVPSGEEALAYLKDHRVDLLVLDMIMSPGIDGLDTYKRVLEIHPGQKAIIASGFSETERVKETQRLGATQYIKKPYTLEKIGLAVKAGLGN